MPHCSFDFSSLMISNSQDFVICLSAICIFGEISIQVLCPILFKNQYFKKMYFFLAVLDLVAAWAFLYLWCTGSLWQWLLFLWASVAVALGVSGWHPLGSRAQAP